MNCVAPGFIIFAYPPQPLPLSCLPISTPSVWSHVSLQSFFEWGWGRGVKPAAVVYRAAYTLNHIISSFRVLLTGLPIFSLLISGLFLFSFFFFFLNSLLSSWFRPISTATSIIILRNKTGHVIFLLKNHL